MSKFSPQKKNVPNSVCPACGYRVDSATCVDGSDAEPAVGDCTICLRCRSLLKFGYDFQLEPLSQKEVAQLKDAIAKAKQP